MAETFLHIEIARSLNRTMPQLTPVIDTNETPFLLGAIAPDLPYFDQLLVSGIRKLSGQPVQYHSFGQQLHNGGTHALCTWLVTHAQSEWQRAFAIGVLSHVATDIVFHRYIEDAINGTSTAHGDLEEQLCLFCYYDLLRNSGVGTAHFTQSYMMFPNSQWTTFWRDALCSPYTGVPPRAQFERWLGSMRVFGLLHYSKHFPWVHTLPADDPALSQTAIDLLDAALAQSQTLITTALAYWNNQLTRPELLTLLPTNRLCDGEAEGNTTA